MVLPEFESQVLNSCLLCVQASLPGVLPGAPGVRLPHRGHLPGVRPWPPPGATAYDVHQVCHQRVMPFGGWSPNCKQKTPPTNPLWGPSGSGVLSFFNMLGILTDSIHLSLSLSFTLYLFPSLRCSDLPVSFIFFYDMKQRRWALVYLGVPPLSDDNNNNNNNNIPTTTAVPLFNAWLVGWLHTDTHSNAHIQLNGKAA